MVQCFFKNGPDLLAGLSGVGEYLYRSTDNGLTWAPYGTGLYEVTRITRLGNELFADSYTLLYHSTDNGATWSQVGPGLPPGMPIPGITTASDYLWIATFGGGFIQHTDSTNFRNITAGMQQGGINLSAVAVNDEWIVFGTIDNGIWYEPIDVITGISDDMPGPGEIIIYPNPTHGKFQITNNKTQINSKIQNSNSKIEIMELFGKIVDTFIPKPGTRNPELDISHLPAGIYFVRISLEDQTIVKKIIKL
jgi:hypothetical protein